MPLYMDFHDGMKGITIEDIKTAHTADLGVQAKYGVTFKQFWVNADAGTVFCLVDGPDKASCQAVHQEAHGNLPCNLSEVESGFYELMMATGGQHGLAMDDSGVPDTASRSILVMDFLEVIKDKNSTNKNSSMSKANKIGLSEIMKFNGRELNQNSNELIGVFNKTDEALSCALSIQKQLGTDFNSNGENEIKLKICISTSQPLTSETDQFFEEGLKAAKRLCKVSKYGVINISSLTNKLYKRLTAFGTKTDKLLTFCNSQDEDFVNSLFDVIDKELTSTAFNVESLSRDIGISRPQLYRKITNLTGASPNNFIRQLRLSMAYEKLKYNDGNIAEVAMQTGFTNPSYFSKCFQKSYGYSPSLLLK